ncbi:hypothetical protein V499_05244 [Pseudogymnoascus sp. VKM F-103]|nr:hypothetical protein V499_05244 [Pseudogymnoascus sp. VKM F-103]
MVDPTTTSMAERTPNAIVRIAAAESKPEPGKTGPDFPAHDTVICGAHLAIIPSSLKPLPPHTDELEVGEDDGADSEDGGEDAEGYCLDCGGGVGGGVGEWGGCIRGGGEGWEGDGRGGGGHGIESWEE